MPWIYRITNNANGHDYIGQHRNNDEDYIGSGVALFRAYKKYGKDNFTIQKMVVCEVEELDRYETELIALYKRNNKAYYNIAAGGHHYSQQYMSDEERSEIAQRISDTLKGRYKEKESPHYRHDIGWQDIKSYQLKHKLGIKKTCHALGISQSVYESRRESAGDKPVGKLVPQTNENHPMWNKITWDEIMRVKKENKMSVSNVCKYFGIGYGTYYRRKKLI